MDKRLDAPFAIYWAQTEINGREASLPSDLTVGGSWCWRGAPVRVAEMPYFIRSELQANASASGRVLRSRAARRVQRMVGGRKHALPVMASGVSQTDDGVHHAFVVTNGVQSFRVSMIPQAVGEPPLLTFLHGVPPRDTELWISELGVSAVASHEPRPAGVICFAPGTQIRTPTGTRAVEALRSGDLVLTRDSGPQPVQWVGMRRMTGARLQAFPELRPIRIRAGAFGIRRPDQELVLSPGHRLLLRGRAAQELFNETEVLVAARELVNGRGIAVDHSLREVTYIHLMLPRHEVIWANGIEAESFHPASAALSELTDGDRKGLLDMCPEIAKDPNHYGSFVRRNLTRPEAALMLSRAG